MPPDREPASPPRQKEGRKYVKDITGEWARSELTSGQLLTGRQYNAVRHGCQALCRVCAKLVMCVMGEGEPDASFREPDSSDQAGCFTNCRCTRSKSGAGPRAGVSARQFRSPARLACVVGRPGRDSGASRGWISLVDEKTLHAEIRGGDISLPAALLDQQRSHHVGQRDRDKERDLNGRATVVQFAYVHPSPCA